MFQSGERRDPGRGETLKMNRVFQTVLYSEQVASKFFFHEAISNLDKGGDDPYHLRLSCCY